MERKNSHFEPKRHKFPPKIPGGGGGAAPGRGLGSGIQGGILGQFQHFWGDSELVLGLFWGILGWVYFGGEFWVIPVIFVVFPVIFGVFFGVDFMIFGVISTVFR